MAPAMKRGHATQSTQGSTEYQSQRIKTEHVPNPGPSGEKTPDQFTTISVFDTIVHVFVGRSDTRFDMPCGLLTRYSSFFASIIKGESEGNKDNEDNENDDVTVVRPTNEAETLVIKLPLEHESRFQRFATWIYTHNVLKATEEIEGVEWGTLLGVFRFAEKYGCALFQSAVVDAMTQKGKQNSTPTPYWTLINPLWQGGYVQKGKGCEALRRLLLKSLAVKCDIKAMIQREREVEGGYQKTFLMDLLVVIWEVKEEGNPGRIRGVGEEEWEEFVEIVSSRI